MKPKALWICLLLVLGPFVAQAQAFNSEDALLVAASQLGTEQLMMVVDTDNYCIVQCIEGSGYVIVDKRQSARRKIIGWSPDGVWQENQMPPALTNWLAEIKADTICDAFVKAKTDIHDSGYKKDDWVDVLPLLTCHWHQASPYNDLCPVIVDGNVKTAAGCVAIAAAQVVYFWRELLPEKTLKDTPTYPYGAAPVTESIAAGTPNKWELLRDDYSDEDDQDACAAVAQLVYVIGTSSYLHYAASTGGQITDAANALYAQFRMTSEIAVKAHYEQAEWERILYEDLSDGYPVIYSGSSKGDGHAVVIDGYDSKLDLFHFNFGWGGSGDGYYTVDDVTGMNGYNQAQQCVYKVMPKGYETNVNSPFMATDKSDIYDMCGRRIAYNRDKGLVRMKKGIYIVKGKKLFING